MVRDPCKGEEDEPQLRPIDVRFTYVVDCALCCAALRGRSSNEHEFEDACEEAEARQAHITRARTSSIAIARRSSKPVGIG